MTDRFAEFLRSRGIDATTQLGSSIRGYTPDIVINDRGKTYLCEAEWDSSKFEGLIQVANYSKLPESSGGLLLLYPDTMKNYGKKIRFLILTRVNLEHSSLEETKKQVQ